MIFWKLSKLGNLSFQSHGGLMIRMLISGSSHLGLSPGAHFSKAPECFRARKASFISSVSKNGEVLIRLKLLI